MGDSIHFCKVGAEAPYENGDMTIFNIAGKTIVFDINKSQSGSSYLKIKKYAQMDYRGFPVIDVLVLSHYDNDHIGDFEELEKRINAQELTIHFIVHQSFDPRNIEGFQLDAHPDLKALFRVMEKVRHSSISAGQNLSDICSFIDSSMFNALCFTPSSDINIDIANEMALGFLITVHGKAILLPSDMSSSSWQRIDDAMINKIKKTSITYALLPHHGSAKFFDDNLSPANDISKIKPSNLCNFGALDIISPDIFILSAGTDFPDQDYEGDKPPHHATEKILNHWNQYQKIRKLAIESDDITINLDNSRSYSFSNSHRPYQDGDL